MSLASNKSIIMKQLLFFCTLFALGLFGCAEPESTADAYGNFETEATNISAEVNGKLLHLQVDEGQKLKAGQSIGLIDTTSFHLQKEQLRARLQALRGKVQNVDAQIDVQQAQRTNLLREQERLQKLVADNAATPKQLDDLNGQLAVIEKQIAATKSQNSQMNSSILSEKAPIEAQIHILEDQIQRCYLTNPMDGIVLAQYARPHEMIGAGMPLYSIAPMQELILRAYASGPQLTEIQLGQQVTVRIDASAKEYKDYPGTITWISAEAEFTPKTIQTREERTNLVYAFKVKVPNDGSLKLGMPAEVIWSKK